MGNMPLKTLSALASAVAAVKKEAGTAPEHKALVASLKSISDHLGEQAEGEAKKGAEDDDYSFEAAEKRHVARNAERNLAAAAEEAK